jgi:hypothetical protein
MKNDDILSMPVKDLAARVAKAVEHAHAIDELLQGMVGLTPDGRKHSSGKFRSGETTALESVLRVAQKKPALFESLATLDEGLDPKKFEPEVLRDRLARVELLAQLGEVLSHLTEGLDDTTLHLGDLSRPALLAAYDIAKSHAKTDGVVADALRPALDFYGRVGRAGAATKRANAKKPAPQG